MADNPPQGSINFQIKKRKLEFDSNDLAFMFQVSVKLKLYTLPVSKTVANF